ncbi:SEC-C metal-binding domain-containing protein [Desulfatibacillum alkenivorans]|uniref:SEC-C metal-binding domain-containing protein n=1 Tax=Desulfatibacillum alkenivorans TaxID=259354 RepID=UPI000936E623
MHSTSRQGFEPTNKRRKGYPSETRVKRGLRIVHGDKELEEKLGRNDPCPCGSARRFKNCCMKTKRYDGSLRDHYF